MLEIINWVEKNDKHIRENKTLQDQLMNIMKDMKNSNITIEKALETITKLIK